MKFMLVITMNPDVWAGLDEETQQAVMNGQEAFMDTIRQSGEFVSTYALEDPTNTRTVRSRDGEVVVTDGPFLETKEFLAGFYLIDTVDEQRAYEVAKLMPDVKVEGLAIEVRPVLFEATA